MDFFGALSCGAHFDNRKFRKDIDIFKHKSTEASATPSHVSNKCLDFFGTSNSESAQQRDLSKKHISRNKKNSKRISKESEEEEEEAAAENNDNDQVGSESEEEEVAIFEKSKQKTPSTKKVAKKIKANEDDEADLLREKMRISVEGSGVPPPCPTFAMLPIKAKTKRWLLKSIEEIGWQEPTPIQMQAIPAILTNRDVIGTAPTGSGKTAAFVIPIFARLHKPAKRSARALIVSPTRELAAQIHEQCTKLGGHGQFKVKLVHGPLDEQQWQASCDVLVTTPLRLIEMVERRLLDLSQVELLVLDEADRLLDEQFVGQIDSILALCNAPHLNKAMFSATMPAVVEELARTTLKDPINIIIGPKNGVADTVKQKLVFVGNEDGKMVAIRQLIQGGLQPPVLIFVQSVERAKELFRELLYEGINVDVIHSERDQAQRTAVVKNFRMGKIWVLIATEVMSRGMDFKAVNLVINYDFPQTVFSYIHRIGRTGRAGRSGEAITYFTLNDAPYLRTIANVMKQSGCDVPEWMLNLKATAGHDQATSAPAIKRKHIDPSVAMNVADKKLAKHARKEAKRAGKMKPWIVADPSAVSQPHQFEQV